MPNAQGLFDFNDATKLAEIRSARIESRGPAKEILLAIASHKDPLSFPSVNELAVLLGCSRRTVQRGLKELEEELGLLSTPIDQRQSGTAARREINWPKLLDLPKADTCGGPSRKHVLGGVTRKTNRGDTNAGRGDTNAVTPPPCHPCHVTGDTPTSGGEGEAHSYCAHITKVHPFHEMKDADELEKFDSTKDEVEAAGSVWLSGGLSREHLRDVRFLMLLWRFAVRRGWIDDNEMRMRWFFSFAKRCLRKKTPGGYFTRGVKGKFYHAENPDDAERAKREVQALVYGPKPKRDPAQYVDENAERLKRVESQRAALEKMKDRMSVSK